MQNWQRLLDITWRFNVELNLHYDLVVFLYYTYKKWTVISQYRRNVRLISKNSSFKKQPLITMLTVALLFTNISSWQVGVLFCSFYMKNSWWGEFLTIVSNFYLNIHKLWNIILINQEWRLLLGTYCNIFLFWPKRIITLDLFIKSLLNETDQFMLIKRGASILLGLLYNYLMIVM